MNSEQERAMQLPAEVLEFDSFLNEPPEYEDRRMVREYRHEAYPRWVKALDAMRDWQARAAVPQALPVVWQEIDEDGDPQWGDDTFSSHPDDIELCRPLYAAPAAAPSAQAPALSLVGAAGPLGEPDVTGAAEAQPMTHTVAAGAFYPSVQSAAGVPGTSKASDEASNKPVTGEHP